MANPQLTAYIQENLSKFSKEAVIQSLSSAGWSAIDISAAFMELEHPAPPVAPPVPAPVVTQPAPAIPPASAIAIEIPIATPNVSAEPAQQRPIGSVEPRPAVAPASATVGNPNDAFLAEMTKRRKEAEALNPQPISNGDVTISVGSTASPVTQGGLVGMVLKTGLVKTEQQANMVLIGIIVVCFGFTAWFIL